MPQGKLSPDASCVMVPPASGTFMTDPAPKLVQYTLVVSIAIPAGWFCPGASVIKQLLTHTPWQSIPAAPESVVQDPASTPVSGDASGKGAESAPADESLAGASKVAS